MGRAYTVIDSDGHILEPLTLWNDYIDPAFRDRAPKLVIDKDGKERLLVEEQVFGSQQGWAASVGRRAPGCGVLRDDEVRGGVAPTVSTRTSEFPTWILTASMPRSSIRAWDYSPARCTIRISPPRCAAPTTAGSLTTASRTRIGYSASRYCRCSPSSTRSRR